MVHHGKRYDWSILSDNNVKALSTLYGLKQLTLEWQNELQHGGLKSSEDHVCRDYCHAEDGRIADEIPLAGDYERTYKEWLINYWNGMRAET